MITVEVAAYSDKDLEEAVDEDLDEFEKFFRARGLGSKLILAERAIIKTYLWWKTHPQEDTNAKETPGPV